MAEQFIYPGALTVRMATPTIVGAPPQHADGSDATYATYFRHGRDLPDRTRADIPATTFASPPLSFEVHYRAVSSVAGSGIGIGFLSTGFFFPLTADGVIRDYEQNIDTLLDERFPDFVAELEAGSFVELNATAPGPITVYEFAVVAILAGAAPTVIPACRQTPREDGLGGSSARRHFPQPRTVQRSGRRGPGSIL